jgi:poly(3-hydroxybutyrate) depolymerase
LYVIPEPAYPLPVIVFHGLKDLNLPYDGGWVNGTIRLFNTNIKKDINTYFLSVNESVSFWVNHNNCNPEPEVNESGNIIKTTYVEGDDDSEVVLFTVKDGGHEWFGSPLFPDRNISINTLMWEFFENHPRK